MPNSFACPCCGHRTLDAPSPSWLTCPVCYWTDQAVDTPVVFDELFRAQRSFITIGSGSPEWLSMVRPPRADEPQAPTWRPLPGVEDGRSPREQERQAIEVAIIDAFADVSPEGRESLRATYRYDYYGEPNIDWFDEDTAWTKIPAEVLEFFGQGTTPFVFGNPIGYRYYMPAYMVHSLRTGLISVAVHALDVELRPGASPQELAEVKLMDHAQREAVVRFLRHVVTYEDRVKWAERALERVWAPSLAPPSGDGPGPAQSNA